MSTLLKLLLTCPPRAAQHAALVRGVCAPVLRSLALLPADR